MAMSGSPMVTEKRLLTFLCTGFQCAGSQNRAAPCTHQAPPDTSSFAASGFQAEKKELKADMHQSY